MVFSAPTLVKFIAAESRTLMDKCRPSRKQHYWLFRRRCRLVPLLITLTIPLWPHISCAITLSHADVQRIGNRIWQNECNGTIFGLTARNAGAHFPPPGIAHSISYPQPRPPPLHHTS